MTQTLQCDWWWQELQSNLLGWIDICKCAGQEEPFSPDIERRQVIPLSQIVRIGHGAQNADGALDDRTTPRLLNRQVP